MTERFSPLPPRRLDIGQPDQPVLGQAPVAAPTDEAAYRAKATDAAVKFESFFIGQMLHKMRESTRALSGDDGGGKDAVSGDLLDMADNLVADQLAGRRAFGIADALLRQLLPAAQAPHAATTSQQEKKVLVEKTPPAA